MSCQSVEQRHAGCRPRPLTSANDANEANHANDANSANAVYSHHLSVCLHACREDESNKSMWIVPKCEGKHKVWGYGGFLWLT